MKQRGFVDVRESNPRSVFSQPASYLVVALFAKSAALQGRCIFRTLPGLNWRRLTLICGV